MDIQKFLSFINHPAVVAIRRLQFIAAAIIFSTLILTPLTPGSSIMILPDWAMHFIGNLLLYLSAWVGLTGLIKPHTLLFVLTAYSIAMELAQSVTPNRTTDAVDLVANLIGLLLAYGIALSLDNIFSQDSPMKESK